MHKHQSHDALYSMKIQTQANFKSYRSGVKLFVSITSMQVEFKILTYMKMFKLTSNSSD